MERGVPLHHRLHGLTPILSGIPIAQFHPSAKIRVICGEYEALPHTLYYSSTPCERFAQERTLMVQLM